MAADAGVDVVDLAAFDRLHSAVGRARRLRQLCAAAIVAAIPVAFVVLWSAAPSILIPAS
ncbi:hypothetical protein [Agromyces sp. NPDC057865]|uniref:hypothetical protein n=1 Tax=Agromyces sp. NPDC057865 TaxID=3346267 RepID=UPI003671BCB3